MEFQDFQEYYPYCVYFYFENNYLVVRNALNQPIFEGVVPPGMDIKSELLSFVCPLPDCFRETPDYLQCYLYDDNKEPIFKNGCVNKGRMDKYLVRKERFERFRVQVKATKLSYMH